MVHSLGLDAWETVACSQGYQLGTGCTSSLCNIVSSYLRGARRPLQQLPIHCGRALDNRRISTFCPQPICSMGPPFQFSHDGSTINQHPKQQNLGPATRNLYPNQAPSLPLHSQPRSKELDTSTVRTALTLKNLRFTPLDQRLQTPHKHILIHTHPLLARNRIALPQLIHSQHAAPLPRLINPSVNLLAPRRRRMPPYQRGGLVL